MSTPSRLLLFIAGLALAGCAAQEPAAPGGARAPVTPGKHLVSRDAQGRPTLQIDYPTEDFCRKVEAVARRDARCEAQSAGDQLRARATLRYEPPGMLVEGHYPDVASCQTANSRMAIGVHLVTPCSAK